MSYLSTQEVAQILRAAGTSVTTAEQVAELARNGIFIGAFQDTEGSRRWQIPATEVSRFIEYSQGRTQNRRFHWLTAGLVGLAISILGLLSVIKDTVDLAVSYVIPTPTPVPLICTVENPVGEGGVALRSIPAVVGDNIIEFIPDGAQIEVLGIVPGDSTSFYQIASWHFDAGPIIIDEVVPDSPAHVTGVRAGDILLQIDEEQTQDTAVLRAYVVDHADQTITLVLQRGEEEVRLDAIPRSSPPEGQGPLGILWSGGMYKGNGGYFPVIAASCPSR